MYRLLRLSRFDESSGCFFCFSGFLGYGMVFWPGALSGTFTPAFDPLLRSIDSDDESQPNDINLLGFIPMSYALHLSESLGACV